MLGVTAAPAWAAEKPRVDASWATEVTSGSANLHAEVNPQGLATTYRFEYISEATFQANLTEGQDGFTGAGKQPPGTAASLGAGATDQSALQHVGPLLPTTTYHYRLVATNHEGTTTAPAHTLTTQEASPAFVLPDDRGWEMVSPVQKNGGSIQSFGGNFGGGVLQAAEQGGAVTYSSASSFGQAPQGAPPASQYLSRRGEGPVGWSTTNVTAPTVSGAYGARPNGVPYQLFSPNLDAGLLLGGRRCRGEGDGCPVASPPLPGTEAPAGYVDYYLRESNAGSFRALLSRADVAGLALPPPEFELNFVGASPDLRHLILSTCAALTTGASEVPGGEGCDPSEQNLYEWTEGQLQLINAAPGAKLAAQGTAVSTDGSRVYFVEGGGLYLREGPGAPHLIASGGQFQTASADGSLAFYTVEEGPGEGHLFRYKAATQSSESVATMVRGVLGASEDGSRVYFSTSAGLFVWQTGTTTSLVAVPGAIQESDYPPTTGTARVSADGTDLLFLSRASLTGFDNIDANTGLPDSEVYLYDASGAGALTCVSCNPTSERPIGPSTIPGASPNGESSTDVYKPRDLSSDGRRVFFDSSDALVPQDTDTRPDVYQWEASGEGSCQIPSGCLGLLSGGEGTEGASFVDASADGSDAFFLTSQSLIGAPGMAVTPEGNVDPGSADLYDARVGGGFPLPPPPIVCIADSCQPLPAGAEDPTVGTLIPGPTNPPLRSPKSHLKKKHPKKKHRQRKSAGRRMGRG